MYEKWHFLLHRASGKPRDEYFTYKMMFARLSFVSTPALLQKTGFVCQQLPRNEMLLQNRIGFYKNH
jgi:hypothetical protein